MRITTNAHRDDYGLSIEIRGHVARLHPAVLAARVAEAVNEAARVLIIPPDPDVPVPDDVYDEDPVDCPVEDPSCEGGDGQCHDACEPSAEHAAAMAEARSNALCGWSES